MSFSRRAAAAFAILAAVGLGAAACGETVLDDKKTEGAIQDNLERSLREKITSVDCPSDLEIAAGNTFACTVVFAKGKEAEATLRILNEDADVKFVGLKPKP